MGFCLELDISNENYNTVRSSLHQISPEMLLFTRRLGRIDISIADAIGSESVSYTITHDPETGIYRVESSRELKKLRYFCQSLDVLNMPPHDSRQGLKESRLIVGFPFMSDMTPVIESEYLFAF